MNTQPKIPTLIALWHKIKPVLRVITTPSAHFYPDIRYDEVQKIRALHVTLLVLGGVVLLVNIPLLGITGGTAGVTSKLVMPSFWLSALIGYILSWRGMWRVALHSVYLVQLSILTSLAFHIGDERGVLA
nr:hypothetical protein [Anaerolineae bacterium]